MAKKSKIQIINNKKALILLLVVLTFVAGFLVARAKYKPQITETRLMVEEKNTEVDVLKSKIRELEQKIELQEVEF